MMQRNDFPAVPCDLVLKQQPDADQLAGAAGEEDETDGRPGGAGESGAGLQRGGRYRKILAGASSMPPSIVVIIQLSFKV